jgi:hypothetical protein
VHLDPTHHHISVGSHPQGLFHFSITAVDAHYYPLTDAARVCVREASVPGEAIVAGAASMDSKTAAAAAAAAASEECIAESTVDQRGGIRDGRWQSAVEAVPLKVRRCVSII